MNELKMRRREACCRRISPDVCAADDIWGVQLCGSFLQQDTAFILHNTFAP